MASLPLRHFQPPAIRWERWFQASSKGTGDVTSLQKDSCAPQRGRVKKFPEWDDEDGNMWLDDSGTQSVPTNVLALNNCPLPPSHDAILGTEIKLKLPSCLLAKGLEKEDKLSWIISQKENYFAYYNLQSEIHILFIRCISIIQIAYVLVYFNI